MKTTKNRKKTNKSYSIPLQISAFCGILLFFPLFCSFVEWFLNYRLSRHSVLFSRCNLNCKIFCFHCAFAVMHGVVHCVCVCWRRHCNKTMEFCIRIMPRITECYDEYQQFPQTKCYWKYLYTNHKWLLSLIFFI